MLILQQCWIKKQAVIFKCFTHFLLYAFLHFCYLLHCCVSRDWSTFYPLGRRAHLPPVLPPLCVGPWVLWNFTPCLAEINLQILFERGFGLALSSFPASKTAPLRRAGLVLRRAAVPAWPRLVWHIKLIGFCQRWTDVLTWSEIACTRLQPPQSQ